MIMTTNAILKKPKQGFFARLFSRKPTTAVRPKFLPGVAVDPVGVSGILFEGLVTYPIAQRVANQCHEVIESGNNSHSTILGGELTPENCEKILEEIRRKFGVDPLREKGGALYEPEGFLERWRRERGELERERGRMRIN